MSSYPHPGARPPRGFTLVELVVVITIIAMLAGAVIPTVISPFLHDQTSQAMTEMSAISEGILGNPATGETGFLSDIGMLPTDLNQLLVRPGTWSPGTVRDGVPRGWNGPYVRVSTPLPVTDPWGQDYRIVTRADDATQWQLHSWGPNRVAGPAGASNDDIIFPSIVRSDGTLVPAWNHSKAKVRVAMVHVRGKATTLVDGSWLDAANPPVLQVSANNGSSDADVDCTVVDGVCEFTNVPLGIHALKIEQHVDTECTPTLSCTLYRQVHVTKPLSYVEVVLPNPPPFREVSFGLPNFPSGPGGIVTQEPAASLGIPVPPGGRLSVTVSGALQRTGGTDMCTLAPQMIVGATKTPTNLLGSVKSVSSVPTTSWSDVLAPAYTTRTFVNATGAQVTMRPAAVLAADPGNNCLLTDGKLVARLWKP